MFDHFDLLAPVYDRAIPFSRLDRMVRVTGLPVDGILLDAGGGTGRVAAVLSGYTRAAIVADYSRGMLAQAFRKGLAGIETPAEHLPFARGTFERVIMIDALHHVQSQELVINELWRVLKPGGVLVIEEPDLRKWQVKILAIVEKLALMRSHFLSPPKIATLFPKDADISIETEGYNAWIIVHKKENAGGL
jgi:ubiquinone/menaquinone biosynthesis C-methylase UbiE